jgi:hypothetical protein
LRTRRSKLYVGAACLFAAIAIASLLLDIGRIVNINDLNLAEKRTLTALRFEDLRGFASYLIGLSSVMAIGMLIERHTGYNAFYEWSGAILKPIATVAHSPTNIHPEVGTDGRVNVFGPTQHGLAATTMLVVVMPFALVRVLHATSRKTWWLNAIAFGLIIAAGAATDRKTALLVPVAVVIYVACYRPRQMLRLAPIGLVALVALVHVASPGALGVILEPTNALSSSSSTHRSGDYSNIAPDVFAHPVIGRGFGTLDQEQPTQFRINDNEYLDEIWQVGIVGLLAYIGMILAPVFLARPAIRGRDPTISSLALAGSAGCIAYLVVSALFDALSFPQAPYVFFIVAALTTIAAAGPAGNVQPIRERTRQLLAAGRRQQANALTGAT